MTATGLALMDNEWEITSRNDKVETKMRGSDGNSHT